mmetsp:Transcript_58763/g.110079  ORF Transcript_58763/g.110079 Transcript_58763/m.110079 type:complete len:344 (+) Transcript_58763:74-1105(+)
MALRGFIASNLANTTLTQSVSSAVSTLPWLLARSSNNETDNGQNDDTGWMASAFLALLIVLAIVAFFWMQRRERMIEQYAEEESRMRNTIAEAQADIDQQVDAEIAASSAATGSSFTATAAALPRPSTGDALNQPPPMRPKVSLPGCGPLPGEEGKSTRASFAATARRSVVQRHSSNEYMLGDDRPSFAASSPASRTTGGSVQDLAKRSSAATTRTSLAGSEAAEARRKSVAELAEARKSLVEVMQMYGPDEENSEVKVNRTSLSGWYDDKDKQTEDAAGRERSLSSWYATGEGRRVSVDASKVVSMHQDGGGAVTVPSGVAQNLAQEEGTAAGEENAGQNAA